MSIFVNANNKHSNLKAMRKVTNIISEISSFFTEKRQNDLIPALASVIDSLHLDKRVFGGKKHHNCKMTYYQTLQLLLIFPFFNVKGFSHYAENILHSQFKCEKDMFYSFMSRDDINWRNILYRFALKLIDRISVRSDHKKSDLPTVLIADDTDLPKTGKRIEMIGKVFSHVEQKRILGFKSLNLCWSDGASLIPVDFSLHGEMGKVEGKEQGLTAKQRRARKVHERDENSAAAKRADEYFKPKGDVLVEMVKRAISYGLPFDFLLVDSWFTNTSLVDFVCSCHKQFHFLGMGKLGNTKYETEWGRMTANGLIAKFDKPKTRKTSKALHCQYFQVDAKLGERKVRLFFCRMSGSERWRMLVTTDLSLDFMRAYRIYSMRWGIEVFYSDSKKHLNLAGCSSTNFSSQLAHVALTCMQYAIMSYVKRAYDYETIGGLFRQTYLGVEDITVSDKIWTAILEVVTILVEEYKMDEDDVILKIVTNSRKMRILKLLAKTG